MNGNDLVIFEEKYRDKLVESFLRQHNILWGAHVLDAYNRENEEVHDDG